MNDSGFMLIKMTCTAIATIGLYTVLYKENKFYRFWEHVFVGLAAGYGVVSIWTETLKSTWWDKLVGAPAADGSPATNGYWMYIVLLPIGLMGYAVFSKKHNWISRIPIGIILGMYAGQQFQAWQNRYIPQINGTMRPILPTAGFFKPDTTGMDPASLALVKSNIYGSQALSNFVFVFTVLAVLSYFLFSFDVKNRLIKNASTSGRWLLMIGFGSIFGTTVMMRFTLLIDRMYFIFVEYLQQAVFHVYK